MQFIEQVFCYTSITLFSSHFFVVVWKADSLLRAIYYDYYVLNITYIAKIHCPAWQQGVMTRPAVTTVFITLNVMRERRELDGVSEWIVLPTYTLFLFVYVYA